MSSKTATQVLADNLRRLMEDNKSFRTQGAVAKRAGVDQKTISNCLNPEQRKATAKGRLPSPTLAQVEKIAGVFGLQVWELLQPAEVMEHAD